MPSLDQTDIWTAIQSGIGTSPKTGGADLPPPYIHPLVKKSSQLLSQKSLEICTESLGSETGSEFSSSDSEYYSSASSDSDSDSDSSEPIKSEYDQNIYTYKYKKEYNNELMAVNYHCSGGGGGGRAFPPPLPSIARRDGRPCLRMRPHRQDGRLVVEAVPVKSNTYLHANRNNGCLRLCFIDCLSLSAASAEVQNAEVSLLIEKEVEVEKQVQEEEEVEVVEEEKEVSEEQQEEEDMEEEEVEVVERRNVIEVKVSTQNVRAHRSSLVINKFLGGTPDAEAASAERPPSPSKRAPAATAATSAAAAVVAAASSSLNDKEVVDGYDLGDTKLLFTSRRRDKEELLRSVRRCSQLRRPLFFWEPCCIATSS